MIGRLLDMRPREAKARAPRAARLVRPHRRRRSHRQDLLRRHAPAAGPRRVARRAPVGDLPRRADDGPGSEQARGHVGRHPAPRRRGLDGPAHDAVPRGGRRARRRDHGLRPRAASSRTTRPTASSGSSAARRSRCGPADPARLPEVGASCSARSPACGPTRRSRARCSAPVRDDAALAAARRAARRARDRGHRAVAEAAEPRRGLLHPDRPHREPQTHSSRKPALEAGHEHDRRGPQRAVAGPRRRARAAPRWRLRAPQPRAGQAQPHQHAADARGAHRRDAAAGDLPAAVHLRLRRRDLRRLAARLPAVPAARASSGRRSRWPAWRSA